MSEKGANIGALVLSASMLVGMLWLVNRGASVVSKSIEPQPQKEQIGIPMVGIPAVSTDMRQMLANEPMGQNDVVAPASRIKNVQNLMFSEEDWINAVEPFAASYLQNFRGMI